MAASGGEETVTDARAAGPSRWPRRHLVVLLTFAACIVAYTDRVNISVAAVAMKEELGWSQTEKGFVLSAFFVGYLLFMFAGGLLSTRFGGKLVLGLSVLAWSVLTLLTPPAAALSMPALIAARIGMGIGEAAMFPGAYELFGRWIPATERARAAARMLSGIPIGTILGLSGGGWLVARFGWPAAFYAFGVAGLVWVYIWFRSITNDPASDPRVGPAELALLPKRAAIQEWGLGDFGRQLLRAPVAAIVSAHFALTWSLYVLLSWLPSYFRDVQGLSIASAGLYSAAPWLAMFATANIAAVVSDRMIERGAPVTRTRKLMQCGSLVATAAILLLLQQAHSAGGAVTLLCMAAGALGVSWAGFGPAMLDVAPRNSAVLYGFSNTIATVPGIIGVSVTGWLVDVTGTYSAAFALTAAMSVLGALAFGIWFSARPVVD
jgi:MFS transporter, ACS family, solute carrier family 17 (sodium-dependent inorganic phosphate cotransporter), other